MTAFDPLMDRARQTADRHGHLYRGKAPSCWARRKHRMTWAWLTCLSIIIAGMGLIVGMVR